MVNMEVRTYRDTDGTAVCNVAFDLTAVQLTSLSHACGEINTERYQGRELEIDDVLALRELTGVRDELEWHASTGATVSMVLTLSRFMALHDAADEYTSTRDVERIRDADREALPIVNAVLPDMADLRVDALTAALTAETSTS